ncbi:hypothetical protein BJX68DRAFT_271788 [Aspergillus pseudodeflectus]|uniref:Uncharacterized protein n=1 Tax=Aspergillus pseudodeflectus TaxID=176178 RepID=A0ABR4JJ74_9EURO
MSQRCAEGSRHSESDRARYSFTLSSATTAPSRESRPQDQSQQPIRDNPETRASVQSAYDPAGTSSTAKTPHPDATTTTTTRNSHSEELIPRPVAQSHGGTGRLSTALGSLAAIFNRQARSRGRPR